MKKLVALILALSLVLSFGVALAEDPPVEAAPELVEEVVDPDAVVETEEEVVPAEEEVVEEEAIVEEVIEEVVEEEAVEANTVPADAVEIVAGDGSSVIINGIEYVYVCFTKEAAWRAGGTPVFWARIYEGDAYLFSMTTGQFLGKFAVSDLSYVNFMTDSYMRAGQTPWIPLARQA